MGEAAALFVNKASLQEVTSHLLLVDGDFLPPLSSRVNIQSYAQKIMDSATRFEAWCGDNMIGLVAAYLNDQQSHIGYLTNVSLLREWTGKGLAGRLLDKCFSHAKAAGIQQICLEVAGDNVPAMSLYKKRGFVVGHATGAYITMHLDMKDGS